MMQKLEQQDRKLKPKAPQPRRTLEASVDKLMKDNFKGWSSHQVDGITRDGLTLRQTLLRDKERYNRGEITMGKNYYTMLRSKFEDLESPAKMLKVARPADLENQKLKDALFELIGHRTNMKPFLSFLEEDVVDNQRTVVAVLKAALDIKPEAGPKQTNCILDVMRWCQRNNIDSGYREEFLICKRHFDEALTKSFLFAKKNDIGIDSWWCITGDLAAMILVREDFEKCINCESQWVDVAVELHRVVGSSALGSTLFGPALRALKHNRAQVQIDELLKRFVEEPAVTSKVMKEYKSKFALEMKKIDQDVFQTFPRKLVEVKYRGITCEVSVNTLMEQCSLCLMACVKGMAVRAEALSPLFVENQLVSDSAAKGTTVAPEVLKEAVAARQACLKLLDGADEVTGEAIMRAMTSRRIALISLDPTFKIEEAFWAHLNGDGGVALVQSRILACLPDDKVEKTPEQSAQELDNLGKTGVFAFSGLGVVGQMKIVEEWVGNMKNGRGPGFKDNCDGSFLQMARQRFSYFARFPEGQVKKGEKKVSGKVAVDAIFADVKLKSGDECKNLTLANLRPLAIFDFLLDVDQRKDVETFTNKVIERIGTGASAAAAAKASAESAPKRRKMSQGKDPRAALVAGYFDAYEGVVQSSARDVHRCAIVVQSRLCIVG